MASANTDATSSRNGYQLGTQFFRMGPLGSSMRDQQCGFGVSRHGNFSTGAFVVFSLPSVSKAVPSPVAGRRSCFRTAAGVRGLTPGSSSLTHRVALPCSVGEAAQVTELLCLDGVKWDQIARATTSCSASLDSSITFRTERLPSGLLSERTGGGRGQVLGVGDQQGNGRLPFHNAGSPGRAWRRW